VGDDDRYIMIFASHSQAAFLYNELLKKSLKVEFVSTPAKIGSSCSKAIIFNFSDTKTVVEEVKKINAVVKSVYKMIKNEKDFDYVKII
jgi:hypothetical protein